ncbi:uncharacterized protein LOC408660 isoform X3 [Apis mellifera]|nr:uncharacterized protein LOC408660 isoform X3 [Apis mellifera]XP_016766268.2 uncharacterized protein LOC408660 isoform X3 [Apis mellifera]|eukprot:XP_016766267.2 uncharacterized protein LOC408660 isoform X3 [Apis mellifera]
MAQPKHVTKKYDPAKAPPLFPRIHPKTLAAKTTKRINDLALPTKRTLLANMRFPTSANIASTLLRVQKSRYRRYRFFCNARQQREMKRKQRILAKLRRAIKPDEWEHHMEVLEILSAPKVPPKPRPIKKKKWRPFNVRRLEELATPPAREMPVGRDPFKVPITALTYKISKRLLKIAFPKVPTEIMPPRVPGQVSPAALKAVGTYFSNFFPSSLFLSFSLSLPPPRFQLATQRGRKIFDGSRRACLLKTGVGKWPSWKVPLFESFPRDLTFAFGWRRSV